MICESVLSNDVSLLNGLLTIIMRRILSEPGRYFRHFPPHSQCDHFTIDALSTDRLFPRDCKVYPNQRSRKPRYGWPSRKTLIDAAAEVPSLAS